MTMRQPRKRVGPLARWLIGWGVALGALAGAWADPPPPLALERPTPDPAPVVAPAPALTASAPPVLTSPAACPPPPGVPPAAQVAQLMRQAQDRGLMWRVTQGGRVSWLYGTIHAARLEWMFPGPQVRAALGAAHRVALELDMLDPDVQRQMAQALRAEPGQVLLPPALADELAAAAQAECAQATLAGLRPEMQIATLSLLVLRRDGLEPGYGVDGFLAGMAHGLGKRVMSLETPQAQMAALRLDDAAERQRMVVDGLQALRSGHLRQQVRRLTQAWAEGDLDALEHYADWCDCLNTDAERAAMHRLLDERNPAMARQIAQWHRGGLSIFAAVGALHLVGPKGLPALLAAQGFQVQRVALGSAQSLPEPALPMPGLGDPQ